jgi:hypothetical protein
MPKTQNLEELQNSEFLEVSYNNSWLGFFNPLAGRYSGYIIWLIDLWTVIKEYKGKIWNPYRNFAIFYEIEAEIEERQKDDNWIYKKTWKKKDVVWIVYSTCSLILTDKSKLWKLIKSVIWEESIEEISNYNVAKLLWQKCIIEIERTWEDWKYFKISWVSWDSKKMMYHERENNYFLHSMERWDLFGFDFSNDEDVKAIKSLLKPYDYRDLIKSPEFERGMKQLWLIEQLNKLIEEEKYKQEIKEMHEDNSNNKNEEKIELVDEFSASKIFDWENTVDPFH